MKTIDFYDDRSNLREVVEWAVKTLMDRQVMVYPTDTVYGLGCDARDRRAVRSIFKIKGRDEKKPFSVVMRDLEMIKKYAMVGEKQEKIIKRLLPGKFTVILKRKPRLLPRALTGGSGTVGVRIPDFDLTREISRKFKNPYVTTSVNLSGQEPEVWGYDIIEKFKESADRPDLIIDAGRLGGDGDVPVESTVVDISGEKLRIVRPGGLKPEEIFEVLEAG
ncbi:MAG: L-threonylcarbamoyladenylate synthase [Patescibacteria group bacterium]